MILRGRSVAAFPIAAPRQRQRGRAPWWQARWRDGFLTQPSSPDSVSEAGEGVRSRQGAIGAPAAPGSEEGYEQPLSLMSNVVVGRSQG